MQKYGIIIDGKLVTSDKQLDGYKLVQYAEIPEFDQLTQAVYMGDVVDHGDYISVDVVVVEIEQGDEIEENESL